MRNPLHLSLSYYGNLSRYGNRSDTARGILRADTEGVVADVVGFLAALVSSVMFLPQAARVWRMRNDPRALQGVSPLGQVLLLINASLWGLYALLTGAYWVAVPGLLNFPLACLTLLLLSRARGVAVSNDKPHRLP